MATQISRRARVALALPVSVAHPTCNHTGRASGTLVFTG